MEPETRRRRRPGWLRAGAALLVAVAALWSVAWLIAAHEAGVAVDDWIASEARLGRQWTCPDRMIDGYPFAIALRCAQPSFAGEITGHRSLGHVEALRASLALGHPRTVAVGLSGPLYLRAADESFDLVASWEALAVSVTGLIGRPSAAAVEAGRLAVTLATPDRSNLNLRAAHLSGQAPPAEGPDTAFGFTTEGVVLPTLDGLPELAAPADVAGGGVLGQATLLSAPTVRRLDAWRAAGGALRLADLTIRQGGFTGKASGTLRLDEAHRPAGRLDASVTGFEPIARRLGIPLAGVRIGGLLGNLLSGGQPPEDANAIALPLILADGRLSVGPIATGLRLDPLY